MDAAQVTLSWSEAMRIALGAGLVSAVATQGLGWLREWHGQKGQDLKAARQVALRVAVHLEAFALQCADLVSDCELHDSSGGHAGKQHTAFPELSPYPELDWKALDISLQARALAFPVEVVSAQQSIEFLWQVAGVEDVADECAERAANYGLRAWALAGDLRSHYGFPEFDVTATGLDPIKFMTQRRDALVKRRSEGVIVPTYGGS
jgi:hypothetical protein